jgi:hypothetical protein
MKPPVKSLLSFKSRSQASGWISFEADNIKAKFQTGEFRFHAKVAAKLFLNFSTYYNNLYVNCQAQETISNQRRSPSDSKLIIFFASGIRDLYIQHSGSHLGLMKPGPSSAI